MFRTRWENARALAAATANISSARGFSPESFVSSEGVAMPGDSGTTGSDTTGSGIGKLVSTVDVGGDVAGSDVDVGGDGKPAPLEQPHMMTQTTTTKDR